MVAEPVSPAHRFTRRQPCPICGGWDGLDRGAGQRCYGFLGADGEYAHCTREDRAGGLPLTPGSDTYAHRLRGACRCGERHDPSPDTGPTFTRDGKGDAPRRRIVAEYDYRAADGAPLFQAVRFEPKGFAQRRRDPEHPDRWLWRLDDTPRVLYRLPELLAADPAAWVYIPEGEKDVDVLRGLGLVATCNVGGAGKWRPEYGDALRGRPVAILPDNDEAGRRHAEAVAQALAPLAAQVRTLDLPGLPDKGDVSDWLAAGGDASQLAALAAMAPPYTDDNQPNRPNRANRERRAFTFTALTDLLEEPEESVAWTVDGLLPTGGVSMVAAKPKVGKSTLARNIALAVARGAPFFDRATAAGPVVYLALEEKRAQVAAHFRRMGATGEEPVFVHVGSAPDDALDRLREAIALHRPVLAIIDPLLKLIRLKDGNDYAEVSRALEPLIDLARESGCHLLCVHHLGKGERSSGDDVLGSTALFGAVDTLVKMRRGERGRIVESVQRYGDDLPEMVVVLDAETGIVAAAGDVATMKKQDTVRAILAALGAETLPEKEIRERVRGNESQTAVVLRDMASDGLVNRTGTGKRGDAYHYAAAPAVIEPVESGQIDSRFARFPPIANRANRETEQAADAPANTPVPGRERVTL